MRSRVVRIRSERARIRAIARVTASSTDPEAPYCRGRNRSDRRLALQI